MSEYALRALPLVAGLLVPIWVRRVARRLLPPGGTLETQYAEGGARLYRFRFGPFVSPSTG